MSRRRQTRGGAADTSLSPAAMRRILVILACAALLAPESGLASASRDSVRTRTDSIAVQGHPVHLADEVSIEAQADVRARRWPAFNPLLRLPDRIEELTGALAPGSSRLMGAPLVRGLDARRTTVTIDGVPIGHSGLRDGSAAIPLGAIGSATLVGFEIFRGPDVLDAGPSSPGGSIRMRSLAGPAAIDPARGNATEVALTQRLSSADRGWSGGLSAAGATGRLRYRAGGFGRLLGDLRVGSDGSATFSSQPFTSLRESSFHSIIEFDGGDRWSATGALISSWREGQPVVDDLARPQLDEIPGAVAVFDPRRFTLAYSTFRIDGIGLVDELQSAVWYNGYRESRTFRRSEWQRTVFDDDLLQAGGVRVEAKFRPMGSHLLTLEADAQVESVRAERWEARDDGSVWGQRGRFPDGSRSRFVGITLSDRWRLDERLSATASARWSHRATHSDYGPSQFGLTGLVGLVDRQYGGVSWRAAIARNWDAGWKVSASIASAFRAPGLDEQVANAFWLNGRDVPNPALRPERATEAELAARLDREGVNVGVSVYRTVYRDLVRRNWFEPGPDGTLGTTDDLFRFTNLRSASVTGADIDASLLAGAFLGFRTELSARAGLHVWGSRQSGVPRYLPPVVGRASVRFTRGSVWFEPFVRFSSAAPAVEYAVVGVIADETSGWTTVNVRGGARVGRELFLGIAVENMMNTRYLEHGSHILGPGRNLVLSGSYRF